MVDILRVKFSNSYKSLPKSFYQQGSPQNSKNPKLIKWNEPLANFLQIGVSADEPNNKSTLAQVFSGNKIHATSQPIAAAYAGHQFGHFVPSLGDGRAHLLGELKAKDQKLYDIQLKGSGRTGYSRRGDGRSPLGPVIREYIVSEAMFHLGVPTTRSLAITATDEVIYRETPLQGGVLTRVSESLIRVGNFEYFAARNEVQNLKLLLDYVVKRNFPQLIEAEDLPLAFFKALLHRQALLVSKWMSLGFVHGVMNTDNTSAVGITIDYGPCAFLDETNFNKVFSSIDKNGRYAFSQQPRILQWNLARLADSLILTYDDQQSAAENFEKELASFPMIYEKHWKSLMLAKIGLKKQNENNLDILAVWLNIFEKNSLDFTLSFRALSKLILNNKSLVAFKNINFPDGFLQKWIGAVLKEHASLDLAAESMNNVNPCYIPRNHILEEIIKDAYLGAYEKLTQLLEVIKNPYQIQEGQEYFATPPKIAERVSKTFCGT